MGAVAQAEDDNQELARWVAWLPPGKGIRL
jgi:hypothetical protein